MRGLYVPILLCACLGAASCASGPQNSRYDEDMARLEADCKARDGILVASGTVTGRPATDNICRISGGATRLPPRD